MDSTRAEVVGAQLWMDSLVLLFTAASRALTQDDFEVGNRNVTKCKVGPKWLLVRGFWGGRVGEGETDVGYANGTLFAQVGSCEGTASSYPGCTPK